MLGAWSHAKACFQAQSSTLGVLAGVNGGVSGQHTLVMLLEASWASWCHLAGPGAEQPVCHLLGGAASVLKGMAALPLLTGLGPGPGPACLLPGWGRRRR